MTVTASNFARKENELYETEPWATEALLRYLPVAGLRVWEPAAGNHMMADVLRTAGADVTCSDIAPYSRDHHLFDFLEGAYSGALPYTMWTRLISRAHARSPTPTISNTAAGCTRWRWVRMITRRYWRRKRIERAALADGARARTEVLWLNPQCATRLNAERAQLEMLDDAA